MTGVPGAFTSDAVRSIRTAPTGRRVQLAGASEFRYRGLGLDAFFQQGKSPE
jgi:hypothetical protein